MFEILKKKKWPFFLQTNWSHFTKHVHSLSRFMFHILLLSNNPLDSDKTHLLMTGGEDAPAQMHLEAPEPESWHLTWKTNPASF